MPLDGALDAHGQPLDLPNDAEILLWHPLMADEGERQAWRTFIISRRIAQPFRQAYREYYFRSADFPGIYWHFAHCWALPGSKDGISRRRRGPCAPLR
ncbi:hypothetical protein AK51_04445 [Serratia nematodiphila DZ0503SBS1]|nr:hypothetical protein AK51_04445 [Serratia nematodiphila DZ0503SBS1]